MLTFYHHIKSLFLLFEFSEFSSCSSCQQPLVQIFQHNGPSSSAQQRELWGALWRIISQSTAQLKMTEANVGVMDHSLTPQHWLECLFLQRQGLSLPCLQPNVALPSPVTKLQSSPMPATVPNLSKPHYSVLILDSQNEHTCSLTAGHSANDLI